MPDNQGIINFLIKGLPYGKSNFYFLEEKLKNSAESKK